MYEKEIQEILDEMNKNPKITNKLNLSGKEAAEAIGCSQSVLIFWRQNGLGPRFIKAPGLGSGANQRCLYPKHEVAKWLAKNMIKTA